MRARHCTAAAMFAALFFGAWPPSLPAAGAPDFKAMPKLQEIRDRPPAPAFALPDAAGRTVALKDFRGKVVLLAFWATWCEFCREELPAMEKLYREFRGRGLEIVGVNIKDKRENALAFVKRHGISYPILIDPEGEVGQLYGAFATPTVYLIDRDGHALARLWGPAGWGGPAARKLIGQLVEQR